MSWTDFFRSRYVRSLEAELATIRKRHLEELETQKNLYLNQISSCITEANRGWAEADRLRQYLIPGLPATTRQTETPEKEPPAMDNTESGTPWQRIQAKYAKDQAELQRLAKEAEKQTKFPTPKESPAIPAQGESHGVS